MKEEKIKYYGRYLEPLRRTEQAVLDDLRIMMNDIAEDPEYSPYEHINSRIKGSESTASKLRKKGYPEDAASALKNLSDIIGVRIITHFVGDIYIVLSRIKEKKEWEILKEKDYIARPKQNGYRSYHVIMRVPFECEDNTDISSVDVEIQLRTIAMDCWAALEHQMRYKKDVKNTELIADELKRCADEMASTDLTMQTIRDILMR